MRIKKNIILILGAPNDDNGKLSKVALDRIECAFALYTNNDNTHFLCVGGFGENFNTTNQPHAYYAKQHLVSKGAKEHDFLEFVMSSNTVEDFRESKATIERESPDLLIVVTSDFHMKRAKTLYEIILKYPNTIFVPVISSLTKEELSPLILHEKSAIKKLKDCNYILY